MGLEIFFLYQRVIRFFIILHPNLFLFPMPLTEWDDYRWVLEKTGWSTWGICLFIVFIFNRLHLYVLLSYLTWFKIRFLLCHVKNLSLSINMVCHVSYNTLLFVIRISKCFDFLFHIRSLPHVLLMFVLPAMPFVPHKYWGKYKKTLMYCWLLISH